MDSKLIEIVDVFSCCIFTPRVLTTVLPAFLLAGAIATFVPKGAVLRFLGPRAKRIWAYIVSALSGQVLSVCSCNVVPLFASIYRQGAGLGPAAAFLYAAPAVHVVSTIMTFKIIGWQLGLWRVLGTPVIAVIGGLVVAWIYRGEEAQRAAALTSADMVPQTDGGTPTYDHGEFRKAMVILLCLLGSAIVGSLQIPWYFQAPGMVLLLGGAVYAAFKFTDADQVREWAVETWVFLKTVMPVLIPAILLIGALAAFLDIKYVYRLVGNNSPRSIAFGAVFGTLMYFPILSEIAFTKAFLKLGMATGPALAILYTGAGLSLPGSIVLGRFIGWKKVLVYLAVMTALAALMAMLFASKMGQYLCPCMMGSTK